MYIGAALALTGAALFYTALPLLGYPGFVLLAMQCGRFADRLVVLDNLPHPQLYPVIAGAHYARQLFQNAVNVTHS